MVCFSHMKHGSKQLGILLALLAGVLWSSVGVLVRYAEGITPLGISSMRSLGAASILLVGILVMGKGKELKSSLTHWKFWLFLGFVMNLHWILSVSSFRNTFLANAQMLMSTPPLFLMFLGAVFFKDKLKLRDFGLAGLTFLGIFLLISSHGISLEEGILLGDYYALAAALIFCVYALLVRKTKDSFPFYIMMFWIFGLAGLFMLGESMVFDLPLFEGEVTIQSWLALVGITLGGTLIGHTGFNISLRILRSDVATLLTLSNPVLIAIWGYILFDEIVNAQGVAGMALTLMGLYFIIKSHAPPDNLWRRMWKRLRG
jgi:drug/metabolite transporter (DMT)-like permease